MSQTQAAEMEFALKYDGPAVETGRMSARELGPAILATAVLLERTSELVYGEGGCPSPRNLIHFESRFELCWGRT